MLPAWPPGVHPPCPPVLSPRPAKAFAPSPVDRLLLKLLVPEHSYRSYLHKGTAVFLLRVHNSISFFVPLISFRAQAVVSVEGELSNRKPIKSSVSQCRAMTRCIRRTAMSGISLEYEGKRNRNWKRARFKDTLIF